MLKKILKRKCKLIEKRDRRGYLSEVRNPVGKKAPVYIYQGLKGYGARYAKNDKPIKGFTSNPEAYARKLARSGHKKVTFFTLF